MEVVLVYHNPRWAKSRGVVSLLKKIKKPFRIVEYLKEPLEKEDLVSVSKKLNMKPSDLVRKSDTNIKKELKSQVRNREFISETKKTIQR